MFQLAAVVPVVDIHTNVALEDVAIVWITFAPLD